MLGKPIAQASLDDISRLVAEAVPEGRHLEFKDDVPVSAEEQRRQRKDNPDVRPLDRSWVSGRSIAPFGRDSLLEELVAFANADGGVIVLGLEESETAPPRAAGLHPLPDVAGLERRLRDVIVECIEPRLPYAGVKGIPTADDGSGVVLIETMPSTLGPHWVRTSRRATIRREDRCDPMTMPELHDMVLRNARRFDDVNVRLTGAEADFTSSFWSMLDAACPKNYVAPSVEQRIESWLSHEHKAALGIRASIVPHHRLGIPRLERLAGLVPSTNVVQIHSDGGSLPLDGVHLFLPTEDGGRRILGGIEQTDSRSEWNIRRTIERDGFVEFTLASWGRQGDLFAFPEWLMGIVGSVLGVYHRLRDCAGASSMPAEIDVQILALGDIRPAKLSPDRLRFKTTFPRYTVAAVSDFDECLNGLAGDLMNAGGLRAEILPRFGFNPS